MIVFARYCLLFFILLPAFSWAGTFHWHDIGNGPGEVVFDISGLGSQYVVYGSDWGKGVYVSQDGGKRFNVMSSGLKDTATYAVDVLSNKIALAGQDAYIYRTTDGARHWKKVSTSDGSAQWMVSVIAHKGAVAYAAASGHMYRSDDRGQTWRAIAPSLGFGATINAISIVSSKVLYVGNVNALYETRNGGMSWQDVKGFDPMTVEDLLLDKERLWVAKGPYGLSVINTKTGRYHSVIKGLPAKVSVDALAKSDARHLFLGTQEGDVYASHDAGVHWHMIAHHLGQGLRIRSIYAPNNHTVYVGVNAGGLWQGVD
jgi:photosystem II stability/assembly factor-like uncharacterized protein